jgi:peptidyl-prolyl cis-trans isomerase C
MTPLVPLMLAAAVALGLPLHASALQPDARPALGADVVAKRGGVSLTLADVDAKIRSMPDELQAGYLAEPERIGKLIDSMLLVAQVAQEGEANGLANDPEFVADIRLARTELLSSRQMQRMMSEVAEPNFELLARERYLSNPAAFKPSPAVDVRHLLISTDGRDEEAARAMAQEFHDMAKAGGNFEELAVQLASVDPKSVSTDLIRNVDGGQLDPGFARALSALEQEGDIVGPVRSRFGYHVIRLERLQVFPIPTFEQIGPQMVADLREQHRVAERTRYLANLSNGEVILNDELILTLPRRHARPPASASADADARQGSSVK